ncbi:MAG: IS4 family transposase [Fibrobacteraceae bacterium]|nr:IS4 family transposase [Fibrobacteraceae bacterium]
MKSSHIFSQILQHIRWEAFEDIVQKYSGDHAAKGISCRSQFITMLFAYISGADSLREITQGMAMQGGNLNHMGIDRTPSKSTLAYANEHRSWEIYRDMSGNLVARIQPGLSRKSKSRGFKGKLFSVDSTTIDLCLSVYPWAKFHHKKGAVKVHTVLDHDGLIPVFADTTHGRVHDGNAFRAMFTGNPNLFPPHSVIAMDRAYVDYELFGEMSGRDVWFVTRLKSNAAYRVVETHAPPRKGNVVSDEVIELTSRKGEACGHCLRRVVVWDDEKKTELVLLCNNLKFGATTIAGIYRQRWQVELFFKQIKQNLKIKSFVGTSENAVKTQIYCALCAIVLLNHLKQISDSRRNQCKEKSFSFSNMVMMLRISLFRCISLNDWLSNPFIPPPETTRNYQQNLCLFGQQAQGRGLFSEE